MLRHWVAVGGLSVVMLAGALLAKPGTVQDRQGDKFKGDVTEDEKFVTIKTPGGDIKLDKRNARIIYDEDVEKEYKARHDKLAANDLKGRMELADWVLNLGRTDLAVAALTEARKIDPMNKDAGRALDAAQAQLDLETASSKPKKPTTNPTETATTNPTTQGTTTAAVEPQYERRMLNADEINTIRQKEMQADDITIKFHFDHNVEQLYLQANPDIDKAVFKKESEMAKATEILSKGDAKLAKDVKVVNDPKPLAEFKQKINPILMQSCGTSGCHGGTKGGDFGLSSGESAGAVYTNFFTLFKYSTTIDGVKYMAFDREVPDRSLALQYGLPRADGKPPHPKVANWKPRFQSLHDPAYATIYDWMTKSLQVLQPDYGIEVSAKLVTKAPTTAPATPAPK